MNPSFFQKIEDILHTERIDSYRRDGAVTPFGHRWGGDVFSLTSEHLEIIRSGQTLALDVMNEYVVFLKGGTAEGGQP